jgi:Tfp pilus assembly protein PilE
MMAGGGIQQVNLYLPELRPRRDLVTAARLVLVVAVMLIGMLLLTLFNAVQRASLRSDYASVQAALADQSARTEQVETEVMSRATDQALVREMEMREQRLAESEDLYAFMSTSNLGNMTGFSAYLMDMSRASFEGLWLTDILIRGNAEYVSLRGNAQQAAMLPDFVSRLAMGESGIRDKRFGRLSTSRTNESGTELYQFVLETN